MHKRKSKSGTKKIWNNMSLISRVPMRKNRLSFLVHSWESCPVNGAFFHASDTWDMEGKKLVLLLCGFSTIRIHCKHINVWWMMTPCTVYDNSSHALLRETMEAFRKKAIQAIRSRFYKCPKKLGKIRDLNVKKNVTSEASLHFWWYNRKLVKKWLDGVY